MTAVVVGMNDISAHAVEIPVPTPRPGEVLVRMAAAPINPSDIGFVSRGGAYGAAGGGPSIPGYEGSGVVVAAGAGIVPRLLLGRPVAVLAPSGGTWAEFAAVPATRCIPLPGDISLEQGSMMLVNPLTALALMEIVVRDSHRAIVTTAAASALGRMILRLCRRYRLPVISVVRRREQADLLAGLGAEEIHVSAERNFRAAVAERMHRLNATMILDAVGGALGSQLLEDAPAGAVQLLYANLSDEPLSIEPRASIILQEKRIEGFFLGNWVRDRNLLGVLWDIRTIRRLGGAELRSSIRERLPLAAVQEAVARYQRDMTAGKVLLVAHQ